MEPHRSHYADLSVFLMIVQFRSFRRAADHLNMTVSALSHRMKALESRLGVRLLNRTSRSVAPTAAGEALAQKVAAGLEVIDAGLDEIRAQVDASAGSVRINVLRDAVPLLLAPVMPRFTERFPLVEIEVSVDDHFVNVTGEGFDAGLRYSGTIPEDMIAARLTGPLGWVAVASPAYVARAGRPEVPEDLTDHKCIRLRTGAVRSTIGSSTAATITASSMRRACLSSAPPNSPSPRRSTASASPTAWRRSFDRTSSAAGCKWCCRSGYRWGRR